MTNFSDALRGYAFPIHERDNLICTYCGWDGKKWPNWLYLSWDHLLPPGHPERDETEYIVTACIFCNVLHNRIAFDVEGNTPAQLVAQMKPQVLERRGQYKEFGEHNVRA